MAEAQILGLTLGFNASGPITKHFAVKLIDADTVGPVTAKSDLVVGVSLFDVTLAEISRGKGVSCIVDGMPLMVVGAGGVTVGTVAVIDATGKVVASNSGARPVGIIMATGVAGDYVPVLFETSLPLVP
jgi:hypothetical protein